MTTENPDWVDVREIDQGGEGVPLPYYRLTCGGEVVRTMAQGQARDAVAWLADKDASYAVVSVIDGSERVVARGRAR